MLKFIGTSSAKVSLHRNFTSFLIFTNEHKLLIDCGEGTSKALLKNKIDHSQINSILITHLHSDHYSGLAGLITQMKLARRETPLNLFIHKSNVRFIKSFLLNSFLFEERLSFDLRIKSFVEQKEMIISKGLHFTAYENSHFIEYKDLLSDHKIEGKSLSFSFNISQRKVYYSCDIGSPADYELITESPDILITELSHITLKESLKAFNHLKPGKMIITHYSDEIKPDLEDFFRKIPKKYKNKVLLSFDGYQTGI